MSFLSAVESEISRRADKARHDAVGEIANLRSDPWGEAGKAIKAGYNAVIGDDIHTLTNSKASWQERTLAAVSIASNFVGPEGKLLTKSGEFLTKEFIDHGGEHLLEGAVAHVRESLGSATIEVANQAKAHAAEALARGHAALETGVTAIVATNNAINAGIDLPDAARRSLADYQRATSSGISATDRVQAIEKFAADSWQGISDARKLGGSAHTAHEGATHVREGAEHLRDAAGTAARSVAASAEHGVDHAAAALKHTVATTAAHAERLTADAERAAHRMTSYVAHVANDVVRESASRAQDMIRHVGRAAERTVEVGHLPLRETVRETRHDLSAATRHAATSARQTIDETHRAANAAANRAESHLAGGIRDAAQSADRRIEASRDALVARLHDASEPHSHATAPPHSPGPIGRAVHDAKERLGHLVEPVTKQIEHARDHVVETRDHLLEAADKLTNDRVSKLIAEGTQVRDAMKSAHDRHESRESAQAALDRMTPEARLMAERSGPAEVGRPHPEARPWSGRGGVAGGSVSSVIGDRVEQYTGRHQWVSFDKNDLHALKKALHENALEGDPTKPTTIREGDKLEVSDRRITLTPRDPSQQRVSVSLDASGIATTTTTPQQQMTQQPQHRSQSPGRP